MDVTEKRGRHACDVCGKFFTRRGDVQRHKNSTHDNQKYGCRVCAIQFSYATDLKKHVENVHQAKRYRCGVCDNFFSYASNLHRHLTKVHPGVQPDLATNKDEAVLSPAEEIPAAASPGVPIETTSLIEQLLPTTSIDEDVIALAVDIPGAMSPKVSTSPTIVKEKPLTGSSMAAPSRGRGHSGSKAKRTKRLSDADTIQDIPPDVKKVYTENWDAIRTHKRIGKYMSTYTVFHRPTEINTPDWPSLLKPIIDTQTRRFKINYSHHFILRNQETQELRFYHASYNNSTVLDMPLLIENKKDFDSFISNVAESQPFDYAHYNRPTTKWEVENILATSFYLYHLDFPIA